MVKAHNVKNYGAKGDGRIVTDGVMNSSFPALTSATAAFTAADVGKAISVNLAGASGIPLTGTIASYTSATQVTLSVSASTSVTGARVALATDDSLAIQAAHDAIPTAAGGKMYYPEGVYGVTANLSISRSNIEVELNPNATVIALARPSVAFKNEYMGLFYVRKSGTGSTQTNVRIHGGTVDCNFQPETSAATVWGSGSDATVVSTNKITFHDMHFMNKGNSVSSPGLVHIHSCTDLNLGRIKNFTVRGCDFDGSDLNAFRIRGTYCDTIKIDGNEFHNIQQYSIDHGKGGESYNTNRTNKNVYVRRNTFHDTMLGNFAHTVYDFGMNSSRDGIVTLHIIGNTFDSINEYNPNDNPNVQVYASWDVLIRGNTFKNTRQALSLGYSNGGTQWYNDPNRNITIDSNNFTNIYATVTDYDSNTMAIWTNNHFYNVGLSLFHAYSMHSFTVFENNEVINCQALVEDPTNWSLYIDPAAYPTPATFPDKYKCIIGIGGQNQYYIRNNRFIDNRKLADPANTSSSGVTTVVGGALSSRTYYYRFAYRNKSGTTNASPSASIAIAANSLVKIAPTGAPTNSRPADSSTTPIEVSGIDYIDIYVGTTSGSETLQTSISYPDFFAQGLGWTEPTTGLVTGAALPTSNTTHYICKFGIYETISGGGYLGPNIIADNDFYGFSESNAIATDDLVTSRMIRFGNTIIADSGSGNAVAIDSHSVYQVGNITGSTTLNWRNGKFQVATLTGNVTLAINSGSIKGESLVLVLSQDATGGRTITMPANIKLARGNTFTPSIGPNATDTLSLYWDGTNWSEQSRAIGDASIAAITKGFVIAMSVAL